MQLVGIYSRLLCKNYECAINYDLGYCFGGPFVLELATTDDIVAGKACFVIY